MRTACKTIVGWQSQFDMLVSESMEHLCLLEIGEARLCSRWWDTKPFVSHLHDAYWGVGDFSACSIACGRMRQLCGDSSSEFSRSAPPLRSIQALAMKGVLENDGKYSFYKLLHRRCLPLGLAEFGVISPSDVDRAPTCACSNSHVHAIAWLKTVANAWTTSYRMHERTRLKCLFGCDAPDRIDHYLDCYILWSILHDSFEGEFPPSLFARLNFSISPSRKMLIVIATAFEIYHALKIGQRSIVDQCLLSGRFAPVVRVATKLARASAVANGYGNRCPQQGVFFTD